MADELAELKREVERLKERVDRASWVGRGTPSSVAYGALEAMALIRHCYASGEQGRKLIAELVKVLRLEGAARNKQLGTDGLVIFGIAEVIDQVCLGSTDSQLNQAFWAFVAKRDRGEA